jgi:hypothetical protein
MSLTAISDPHRSPGIPSRASNFNYNSMEGLNGTLGGYGIKLYYLISFSIK